MWCSACLKTLKVNLKLRWTARKFEIEELLTLKALWQAEVAHPRFIEQIECEFQMSQIFRCCKFQRDSKTRLWKARKLLTLLVSKVPTRVTIRSDLHLMATVQMVFWQICSFAQVHRKQYCSWVLYLRRAYSINLSRRHCHLSRAAACVESSALNRAHYWQTAYKLVLRAFICVLRIGLVWKRTSHQSV